MNSRTKYLLLALAAVGVAIFADRGYRRFIVAPADAHEKLASRLADQIKDAEDTVFRNANVIDQLLALEQYSLPYDKELARARYQDWLLALVKKTKLQQPSVDSNPPTTISIRVRGTSRRREVYQRYVFSVRGRGTLGQVTQLLFAFYQGGHLHKIRSLSLNPVSGGKQLDVTMSIEAIGLARCERESELSTLQGHRLAKADLREYQAIVRRNIFSQEGGAVLRNTKLTAVTVDRNGKKGAWFSLGDKTQTQVAHRGDVLQLANHQVVVIDIQTKVVVIEVDGTVLRLPLGKSIFELLEPMVEPENTASGSR